MIKNKLSVSTIIVLLVCLFPVISYAASSVYIPGVPSASSSSIGISCNYNGLGTGTIYCQNSSPGSIVTCNGSSCTTSAGYSNRLLFVTPNTYNWQIPAGVSKAKVVVIGPGGNGVTVQDNTGGGGGGGYAESTFTGLSGNAVSITVTAGGSQSSTQVVLAGTTISAAGGNNGVAGTPGTGGCGSSNANVYTCGGNGFFGGAGAGGPIANGGTAGTGGGGFGNGITSWASNHGQYGGYSYGSNASNLLGSNGTWYYPQDIMGPGGKMGSPYQPAGGPSEDGENGDLGGGGGMGGYGGTRGGNGGNGGFGGGGGSANEGCNSGTGGNGGIGGGGAQGNSAGGTGGNGIAIIYW
ncbi:MAG: hypothetical protein ABSB95_14980 [Dissulfurispiraceae bacterium]|jgi:hypothetical protein